MAEPDFDLDDLIRTFKANDKGKDVYIPEDDLKNILIRAREILKKQPVFLELMAPVTIVGDIHGQFVDLLRIFKTSRYPPHANYLFLGDYVDRGKNSLECIVFLFCLKIKYPFQIFLLRGNHETEDINRVYGFYDEMNRRYPKGPGIKLWKLFQDVFSNLPISALVAERLFCMHGGMPKDLNKNYQDWSQIKAIKRPYSVTPDGIICDLLWADPSEDEGMRSNNRGVSILFGPDVLEEFCMKKGIDMIVRAHQVVENGYEFVKGPSGHPRLVTIFSAPNYCGEFDNNGGLMKVDKNLRISMFLVRSKIPSKARKTREHEVTSRE